jgi:hypothetical protein
VFERAFNRQARRAKALGPPRAWPGSGLHVCSACRSDFVHSADRRREGEARWRLGLRCGRCGACRDVIVSDDLLQRFDADVSRGLGAIAGDLATLDREHMAQQVEAFSIALERDLIDPGDFRP